MNLDEYNKIITSIRKQLEDIANRTENQAILGVADASNPTFIALMRQHAQLTKLSTELTERMLNQVECN